MIRTEGQEAFNVPRFYSIYDGKPFETRLFNDAEELGGLPSVSSIACLNKDPSFMDERASAAGTEVHAILEHEAKGIPYKNDDTLVDADIAESIRRNYREWMGEKERGGWMDSGNEVTIIDRTLGYGGRVDKILSSNRMRMIVDWKTQNVVGGTPRYPKEWAVQLAGYCMENRKRKKSFDYLISVVVDRKTGKFYEYQWSDQEFEWAWDCFKKFHAAYCAVNKINIKQILSNYFNKNNDLCLTSNES